MADDCKSYAIEHPDETLIKAVAPSSFHRSSTFNSSSPPQATTKPLYDLYTSPAFSRTGSIKSFYTSPFGSIVTAGNSFKGKVKKLCSIFETPKTPPNPKISQLSQLSTKLLLPSPDPNFIPRNIPSPVPDYPFRLPGTEDRVVIYFTSLRGIRRTFHDCQSIQMIFRNLRVNLDERDISMDVAYKKELQKVLGEDNVSLPQVFIKGKYIGGADVVKQLLEAGELVRLIKGLPLGAHKPCDACDDVRFYPCTNCNGSRKVFDDDEAKRCPDCNENGLVRCPLCCS